MKKTNRTIKVFGQSVKMKFKKCDDATAGEYDSIKKEITISKTLKGDELVSTVLHEQLHAVISITGIRQAIDGGVEEIIVENIANFLTDTYKLIEK